MVDYTYKPTAKSYFSGMGGMDMGLSYAGLEVRQSLEIDKAACQTLSRNFTHRIVEEDICGKTVLDQERTDVSVFTYPCTKYSTIADIHGTRTGDDLFLHSLRHLALESPEAYVVENVPGMRKFPVVMEAMSKLPNYYITVFCPINSLTWLPQVRKRLIIIGTKRRFHITPPSGHSRVKLSELIEETPQYPLPKYLIKRLNGGYRDRPIIVDPKDPDAVAPTCVSHYAKDLSTRLVVDKSSPVGVRPFTPREYARLQGFPDSFWLPDTREAYKQIGNAVSVPMGEWIGTQLMKYFNKRNND